MQDLSAPSTAPDAGFPAAAIPSTPSPAVATIGGALRRDVHPFEWAVLGIGGLFFLLSIYGDLLSL